MNKRNSQLLGMAVFVLISINGLIAQINVEQMEKGIAEYTSHADFNGRIVLFESDSIVLDYMHGLASFERNEFINPATTFNIASVSKMITALGILDLIDKEKLFLSTSIAEFYPDLPGNVNIENLLNHTSGLQKRTFVIGHNWSKLSGPITSQEFIEYLAEEPMRFEPNEKHEYNNVNYILLYDIFQKVSGNTIEEEFHDQGLFSSMSDDDSRSKKYAYNEANGQWIYDNLMLGNFLADHEYNLFGPGHYYMNPRDAIDIVKGWEGLSPELLNKATNPGKMGVADDGRSYGYGIALKQDHKKRPIWFHMGKNYGSRAYFAHYPEQDVSLMMVTNVNDPNFNNLWPKLESLITGESDFEMPELSIAYELGKKIHLMESQKINSLFYTLKDQDSYYTSRIELNDMAYHLWEQDQKTRGLEVLRINSEMFPENYSVRYYYAEGLEELGDYTKALAEYKSTRDIIDDQLDPESSWFEKVDGRIAACESQVTPDEMEKESDLAELERQNEMLQQHSIYLNKMLSALKN